MVEASRIVIGVYALLILAYATAFLRQRYIKRKALEIKLELDTMSSAYYTVHRELTSVNDGLESVIGESDPVHDRLAAHSAIDAAERMLSRLGGESISRVCDLISHPARLLAMALENDVADSDESLIAMGNLTRRLGAMLDSTGVRPDDLTLTSSQFERLGSLFEEHDVQQHARDAYEASLREGHRFDSMSGLLRIIRVTGTRNELIEALEAHIDSEPDDMPALIEQLSLLPESDSRSSRNRRRLASLDWDGEMEVEVVGSIHNLRSRAVGPDVLDMSPAVRVKRARKKISEGMLDEGLELLDGMTLEERNDDEVLFMRAKIAHLKGHYDLALRLIRDIRSESDDSILLEVSIIVSMGMADSAIAHLNSKVDVVGSPALYEAGIKLSIAVDDLNNALTLLDRSRAFTPTIGLLESEVLVLMNQCRLERDNTGSVPESLISRLKDCSLQMTSFDREDHRSWLAASYYSRLSGDLDEARTCIVRARRIAEMDPNVLIEEARILIETMDFDEARSVLRECDKVRADKVEMEFLSALAYAREGRMEEAERRLLSVVKMDPSHVSGRLNLTMLYLIQDKYDLAAQHSTEVVRTRPNNPIAIKRSAEAMVGLSLWEEAIDLLEGAISSQIGDVDAMALLASCLIKTGRGEQAEALLNEAIRLDPSDSESWACRARLYLEFNRVAEAMSDLEKASECNPRRFDVLMILAELEEKAGDYRAAYKRWRQVLDIDPSDQHARSRLRLMSSMAGIPAERVHVR